MVQQFDVGFAEKTLKMRRQILHLMVYHVVRHYFEFLHFSPKVSQLLHVLRLKLMPVTSIYTTFYNTVR